jgi:predicted MFS family arabinose efflux permease
MKRKLFDLVGGQLDKAAQVLLIAVFFNFLGYNTYFPYFALHATSQGVSLSVFGLALFAGNAAAALSALTYGHWTKGRDRSSEHVLFSLFVLAAVKLMLLNVGNLFVLFSFNVINGVAAGIFLSAWNAAYAHAVHGDDRVKGMSIYRFWYFTTLMGGNLAGAFIADFANFNVLILFMTSLLFIAAFAAIPLLRQSEIR